MLGMTALLWLAFLLSGSGAQSQDMIVHQTDPLRFTRTQITVHTTDPLRYRLIRFPSRHLGR